MTAERDELVRILHFLPGNAVSGISLQTMDVACVLEDRGYENTIVTPDEKGKFTDLAANQGLGTAKLQYFLPKHFTDFSALKKNIKWTMEFIQSVYKIKQYYNQEQPDIVHLNGLLMLQPALAAVLADVDIVWYLVSDNIYPKWLVRLVMPFVNATATEVVLITESNREFYRQQGRDISVIPGTIDVDELQTTEPMPEEVHELRQTYDIGEDEFVVTTIGRTHPMKGQEYAIEAIASIASKTDRELTYLIVGPTHDESYANHLEEQISELGMDDRIYVTGFVENKKAVLELTDVFLLPSIGEGTPLSIMEALALKIPVIATKVGGIPELLDDGRAGQLVAPRCPDEIATALQQYLDSPDMAERHGVVGHEHIRSSYDISVVAGMYEDVYRGLSQNKSEANFRP